MNGKIVDLALLNVRACIMCVKNSLPDEFMRDCKHVRVSMQRGEGPPYVHTFDTMCYAMIDKTTCAFDNPKLRQPPLTCGYMYIYIYTLHTEYTLVS